MSVAEVDEVIVLKPAFCARCQQPLAGDDPQPQRHHVCEIPPMRPVVTEYQVHRLSCPGCGEATRVAWPAGVPRGWWVHVPKRLARCVPGRIACRSAPPSGSLRRIPCHQQYRITILAF